MERRRSAPTAPMAFSSAQTPAPLARIARRHSPPKLGIHSCSRAATPIPVNCGTVFQFHAPPLHCWLVACVASWRLPPLLQAPFCNQQDAHQLPRRPLSRPISSFKTEPLVESTRLRVRGARRRVRGLFPRCDRTQRQYCERKVDPRDESGAPGRRYQRRRTDD